MSTKDNLAKLSTDAFDHIGRTAKPPAAAPEPEKVVLRQMSFRVPIDVYQRWKMAMIQADETQEEVLLRLITDELERLEG